MQCQEASPEQASDQRNQPMQANLGQPCEELGIPSQNASRIQKWMMCRFVIRGTSWSLTFNTPRRVTCTSDLHETPGSESHDSPQTWFANPAPGARFLAMGHSQPGLARPRPWSFSLADTRPGVCEPRVSTEAVCDGEYIVSQTLDSRKIPRYNRDFSPRGYTTVSSTTSTTSASLFSGMLLFILGRFLNGPTRTYLQAILQGLKQGTSLLSTVLQTPEVLERYHFGSPLNLLKVDELNGVPLAARPAPTLR